MRLCSRPHSRFGRARRPCVYLGSWSCKDRVGKREGRARDRLPTGNNGLAAVHRNCGHWGFQCLVYVEAEGGQMRHRIGGWGLRLSHSDSTNDLLKYSVYSITTVVLSKSEGQGISWQKIALVAVGGKLICARPVGASDYSTKWWSSAYRIRSAVVFKCSFSKSRAR